MQMAPGFELLIVFVIPLSVFLLGALWGRRAERLHFEDLTRREKIYADFPIYNWRKVPQDFEVSTSTFVSGAVVISEDAGKRLLARFRNVIGGNIKSYETLMDRGRREACLRMLDQAKASGANALINVRYDTADLTTQREKQAAPIGIEVLVFGTAVHLRKVEV